MYKELLQGFFSEKPPNIYGLAIFLKQQRTIATENSNSSF